MKKTVKIEGLDCPNCARTLEGEINKLDCVNNAHIEFVKSTLSYESDKEEESLQKIIDLTKKLEPRARIISDTKQKKFDKVFVFDLVFLLVGIAIGVTIFFVKLPTWAYWTLYTVSALLLGYKTYIKAILQLFKGVVNENLLITISVIGASAISEHMEGLMVIALYSIGKIFEGLAVNKSRKSIEKLAKLQPEYVNLLDEEGNEKRVSPEDVAVGSFIVVKAGERVPIDGVIVVGSSNIDMQSLTGESNPVFLEEKAEILSGSIVLDGVLKVKTTSDYKESTISKIMNLVENASQNKSKTETFISKITKWYTLGIVVLALTVWAIVWGVSGDFNTALYRGLIFLVISCPCAFAISVPLAYFSGLGNASKHGVLIKGSNFLDACAKLKVVAFDKTGTLTTGKFKLDEVVSLDKKKTQDDILYLASLGEQNSLHPLAKTIVEACDKKLRKVEGVKEIAGSGVEYIYNRKKYFVGRKDKSQKSTVVELYENDVKIGEIYLSDTIKHTSKATCEKLKLAGIKTVLLSGDNQESVDKVANEVGVEEAFCQLLPQDKYTWIEKNKNKKSPIGYVGDGINDAPSLTLADVGFSMGINGSPASIEASDVVLVDDNPEKIMTAIKISKYTRKIVIENIALSAIVKIVFLTLGSAGITGMLSAVFADVGVTLLAIINSMRALRWKIK